MNHTVSVCAPGRLHFGLSSFGGEGRQFSGLGMMVDGTGVSLEITPAKEFETSGPLASRVKSFVCAFAIHQNLATLPPCHIKVLSASPEHVGLGVGTQLGLAVVAGLAERLDIPWRDANVLSQMSGRGKRSAIGTHGFLHGGLLVDAGKLPGESLGLLATRVDLPTDWRFVLIRQPTACGIAGETENKAIDSLAPVPAEMTNELHQLIDNQILPAARSADWQQFSEAIYQYGYQAGECFAPAQGGPFASPEIAKLVHTIRELGCPGAGQSSWGPTVFAITEDQAAAESLVAQLTQHTTYQRCDFTTTHANNSGAEVTLTP